MSTRMKNSTVIKEEIDKFSKMSEEWWDPNGKFKPLHKFNPIRVKYIIDNTLSHFKINKKSDPLNGLNILDVGCGGGLLTEPLSRLGANVIGIDASKNNIEVAKRHLKKGNLKIPHMGWNQVEFKKDHFINNDIPNSSNFYFVHSYASKKLNEKNLYNAGTFQIVGSALNICPESIPKNIKNDYEKRIKELVKKNKK